jgi:hypothetical protein
MPGWGRTRSSCLHPTPLRPLTYDRAPPTSGFSVRGREAQSALVHSGQTEGSPRREPERTHPDAEISGGASLNPRGATVPSDLPTETFLPSFLPSFLTDCPTTTPMRTLPNKQHFVDVTCSTLARASRNAVQTHRQATEIPSAARQPASVIWFRPLLPQDLARTEREQFPPAARPSPDGRVSVEAGRQAGDPSVTTLARRLRGSVKRIRSGDWFSIAVGIGG